MLCISSRTRVSEIVSSKKDSRNSVSLRSIDEIEVNCFNTLDECQDISINCIKTRTSFEQPSPHLASNLYNEKTINTHLPLQRRTDGEGCGCSRMGHRNGYISLRKPFPIKLMCAEIFEVPQISPAVRKRQQR